MEKYYDPEKYMELGTCFDGVHKMGGRKMNQEGYRNFNLKSLTEEEERLYWQEGSFQIRGQRRKLQLNGERES